jgi:multidrug efflux pump subunit AcrB
MAYKHKTDAELIESTHNTARFFTEHRQVAMVLLLATFAWGWYGYTGMPKRKDPNIPMRVAVAQCPWPGATAEQVEQLIARPMEQATALNSTIKPPNPTDFGIRSLSMPGMAVVTIQLDDSVTDIKKQFSDINLKLNQVKLPQGAGPIQFNSDFGDAAAMMLTVASPPVSPAETALRAEWIRKAIEKTRSEESRRAPQPRVSVVYCFPFSVSTALVRTTLQMASSTEMRFNAIRDQHLFEGPGFVGVDVSTTLDDQSLRKISNSVVEDLFHLWDIQPEAWQAAFIHDPAQTDARLAEAAGDKYSYRQLDDFTELIQRTLQGAPEVSRVDRSGVLPEQINLVYSQERLAQYGYTPSKLQDLLAAQNITLPAGTLQVGLNNVMANPSGLFPDEQAIANVMIGRSSFNSAVYLRDLVDISRGYQSPPSYLNYLTWRDSNGNWRRTRAITVAAYMRTGSQIGALGKSVDQKLASVRQYLPPDVLIVHTSDQPLQVKENVSLFMDALYEAIVLVVLVSFIGFWEWRPALLMACSIPVTLAMIFGMVYLLHIDLQQVSIASLIIALGLLVDDPVVAGDAIKQSLADGHPRIVAPWLGPTRLAKAIMYATVANIVAYLPLLLVHGTTGEFIYSLPIVIACALIASRLVSMTFIPLLGYYFLRPSKRPPKSIEQRRSTGFTGQYAKAAQFVIRHRWVVAVGSLTVLAVGVFLFAHLKTSFFPEDVQYWSYIDVWLPNGVNFQATNQAAQSVEAIIRQQAEEYGRRHPDKEGRPTHILKYLSTFVGGGGPRFWFSLSPQPRQLNYAQVIVELDDKDVTPGFVKQVQRVLAASLPGVRADFRQLQTNPLDFPIDIRISSKADVGSAGSAADIAELRAIARRVEAILRSTPGSARVRNDWEQRNAQVSLEIDPDRANLAGITNSDVASSTTGGINGTPLTTLQEGWRNIPVVGRLRMDERAQLSDLQDLYVYSSETSTKIPLAQISSIQTRMVTPRIVRLDHFRTMSVRCFAAAGFLPSQVLKVAMPRLQALDRSLPPGYGMKIGGEYSKQQTSFRDLSTVLAISVVLIFIALLFQFDSAIKPMLVFAAVPYGVVGAVAALWIMGTPFGFMAFLGVASLVGVIISHVIVLFDYIEEMHAKGEPFLEAVVDAGIMRLRPVLITVGATVLALFPLAAHGGPLWEPLCYAQIGGLSVATFITLLMVPVFYSIFVLDLKILSWDTNKEHLDNARARLAVESVR